jgi:hypothetical protein
MAKHLPENPQVMQLEAREKRILDEKVGRLSDKAVRVIFKALTAEKPCYICVGANREPKKKDEHGNCYFCGGTGLVDDFERNKWGSEQVLGRRLPMPKAVEMKISDSGDKAALAAALRKMDPSKILEMQNMFNAELDRISKMPSVLVEAEEEAHVVPD